MSLERTRHTPERRLRGGEVNVTHQIVWRLALAALHSSLRGRSLVGYTLAAATAVTLAASAWGSGGPAPEGGLRESLCELPRVERARTPSVLCVTCHDGSVGPGVPFQMSPGGGGMNHPVDVDYAQAALRHAGKYASPFDLPPEVPLVNGRVACTSCHDGAAREANHVVNPAKLCEACHRL